MSAAALAYATQLLASLPALISAGISILQLVKDGNAKLELMQSEMREPTPEEWDELNERIKLLQAQLHSGE